ncbi:hypothetical protein Ddye_014874 [Dipteronia dyeriana]|uniref:UspA domain-containing protein n=1 Tax=Dipteronia dyeriana TaxID=168575 RepID=A0AAD9WZ21_9ROSI|nr:hypothetical protein Ddye_014874 [Dipteronia dyeriana]
MSIQYLIRVPHTSSIMNSDLEIKFGQNNITHITEGNIFLRANKPKLVERNWVVILVMEETLDASAAMQQEQQQPLMRMKVMVAIDDSEESFGALKWVLDNLYGIAGVAPEAGMLTMVHVQEQYFFPAGPGPAAFYGGAFTVMESVRKAKEEMNAALLARALQTCRDKMR